MVCERYQWRRSRYCWTSSSQCLSSCAKRTSTRNADVGQFKEGCQIAETTLLWCTIPTIPAQWHWSLNASVNLFNPLSVLAGQ
eukprot:3523007-Prorocentrum_lima.AAC.1